MTSLSSSWCQARSAGSEPQQERGVVLSAPGAPAPLMAQGISFPKEPW